MAIQAPSPPQLPDLDFEAMAAEELIAWTHQFFWPRVCLTCSWQKQSSVLVHMVAELGLRMDTVELDTHLFFRESYDTRDALVERYQLKLIQPVDPDGRRAAPRGRAEPVGARPRPLLPHPQGRAARQGARSRTTPGSPASAATSRRAAPRRRRCEWSERYQVFKIHPLADWDEKRVWAYIDVNEIPSNPLHDAGYRSIGCIPCTRPTSPDEEERAGRWAGSDKLECGIHENTRLLKGRHEPAHLRARPPRVRDATEAAASRSGSRGSPAPGRRRSRTIVGPEIDRRGLVVEYLDGDTVRTHLSKGLGFSKEDRDTNVERHRLGRVAHHAAGRRRHRRGDLAVRARHVRRRARWWRSSARSSRSTSARRSTSAPVAT